MADYRGLGKAVPRVDAVDKVTGTARYAADMNLPGMLWGKFVRSPHPHARIKRIDTSRAEALPGVRAVITQRSLGADATIESEDKVHGIKASRKLFCDEYVRYQGEMIGAVAADSAEIEPHACLAKVEPNGRVTVWTSTQSIFTIRSGVASSLGIPMSKVNVIGMTIGGGFGGKFGPLIHPYAVILSRITGRPVKMVLTREEEM